MKRIFVLVPLLVFLVGISGFAQNTDNALFVKTIPILKVYTHALGYKVLYLRNGTTIGEMYLPVSWFGQTAGKAQLVWGIGPEFPYMSVYYRGDKFDHLRLYVLSDMLSPSWGVLQLSLSDATPLFTVDAPPLEY